MVAHHVLYILCGKKAFGFDKQRHRLGIRTLTRRIGKITVHPVGILVEEAPYARLAETQGTEIGRGVCVAEGKFAVFLSRKVSFFAGKTDDILRIQAVCLVL